MLMTAIKNAAKEKTSRVYLVETAPGESIPSISDAMQAKKTVAERLIELVRMTADQLHEQRVIARGKPGPFDDSGIPGLQIPEKIRQEIIEAELQSGEISN
jgi:hypothetical protein